MPNPVLSQPRPTRGKTVGKAVIKSYIHDVLHGQEPGFKPLYTQNRFNAMVEGLGSEREYTIYLQYVAVFNGISEELVRSQAYAQQAQHGLLHLQAVLADIRRAEDQQAMLAQLTALGGLGMHQPDAYALLKKLSALFISLDSLEADDTLRTNLRGYYDQLLFPALRGLCAYNALLCLLADALEIPELVQLKAPLDDILRDIDAYAADLASTPALLWGSETEVLAKQRTLDEAFLPVTMDAHQPDPGAISAVQARLAQPNALQTGIVQQLFLQLLGETP